MLNIILGIQSLYPCTLLEVIFPNTNTIAASFSADDQQTVVKVTITNDKDIFNHLFTMLFFNPNDIKIKFESILSKVSENYFQPLLYPFHFHYSIWHKDYN